MTIKIIIIFTIYALIISSAYSETKSDTDKQGDRKTEVQIKKESDNKSAGTAQIQVQKDKNDVQSGQDKKAEDQSIKKNDKEVKKETNTANNEKKRADQISEVLDFGINKERKTAINQILTIKDSSARKPLEEKLINIIREETDSEVKLKAITVAGELKLKQAVNVIIDSLNDESEGIQVSSVYALKRIADDSAKPALIAKLKDQKLDKNTNFIESLIDTLGEFQATELREYAENKITDNKTNQIIRELLILFLGKIKSQSSKDILIKIFNDDEEEIQIRSYAVNSLANMGIKEAAKDIEAKINEIEAYPFNKKKDYYNLYMYAVAALAKLGDTNALPRLINALRSDNALVRLKAIKLIKEINDKRTIDILQHKMKYDPSVKVQNAAREALKQLGVDVGENEPAKKPEVSEPEDETDGQKNKDTE